MKTYDDFIEENYSLDQKLELQKACQEEEKEIAREKTNKLIKEFSKQTPIEIEAVCKSMYA